MSGRSFLESRETVKAATLPVCERRKQSLLCLCPDTSVSLRDKQWVPGASLFHGLGDTCEASRPQDVAECQPSGCGLLQIVFINTLLCDLVLNPAFLRPSPDFASCHPCSAADLREHTLDTRSLLRRFLVDPTALSHRRPRSFGFPSVAPLTSNCLAPHL